MGVCDLQNEKKKKWERKEEEEDECIEKEFGEERTVKEKQADPGWLAGRWERSPPPTRDASSSPIVTTKSPSLSPFAY